MLNEMSNLNALKLFILIHLRCRLGLYTMFVFDCYLSGKTDELLHPHAFSILGLFELKITETQLLLNSACLLISNLIFENFETVFKSKILLGEQRQ
jgi:hypothetical protein